MAAWCILLWWKMKCENQGKIRVLLDHTPTNFDWEILVFALLILKNKGLFSIVFFIFETHTHISFSSRKKWTLFERV